jgi:hypothetical protein
MMVMFNPLGPKKEQSTLRLQLGLNQEVASAKG